MTRSRRLVLSVAALSLGLPGGASAGHRPPAHLLVFAQEWSLWTSRVSVPAGTVKVQLDNRGQDAHDLRVQHLGRRGRLDGPVHGVAVTASGHLTAGSWHLRAGRYLLFCGLPGHRARGMHTVLVVK